MKRACAPLLLAFLLQAVRAGATELSPGIFESLFGKDPSRAQSFSPASPPPLRPSAPPKAVPPLPLPPEAPDLSQELDLAYALAGELTEKRKFDEAINAWKRVLEQDAHYRDAEARLASCYMARGIRNSYRGNHYQAVRDFEEALKLTPDDDSLKKFLEDERRAYRANYK